MAISNLQGEQEFTRLCRLLTLELNLDRQGGLFVRTSFKVDCLASREERNYLIAIVERMLIARVSS